MSIPKIVNKNNRKYIFVKEYNDFIRYKDIITGCMMCFSRFELGLVKETIQPRPKESMIRRRVLDDL
jgi:hypothetical protein